jgi:hypothetical protein
MYYLTNEKFKRLGGMLAAFVMIAGASVASADELSLQTPHYSKISGVAHFERHHTVIPLTYCNAVDCIRAKPYWAMVVQAGSSRYELNQVFNEGSERAPEAVRVGSVVIRPGSRVVVQGHVDVITRDYAVISDIQKIDVVMDEELRSQEAGAPFFGWTCHSIGETHPVYVDVTQVSRNGGYAMKILSDTGTEQEGLRTVANFGEVRLSMTDESIAFEGSTHRVSAQLAIDQRAGRINDLDSMLHMTNEFQTIDREFPVHTTVRLACNRTR